MHSTTILCRLRPIVGLFSVAVLFCMHVGCNGTAAVSTEPGADQHAEDGLTASDILQRMAEAYRQAEYYLDNAQYHERYVRLDDGIEYDVPSHVVSVAFHRPGRIRINRQVPAVDSRELTAAVTSNGDHVRSFVGDCPQQVLEHSVPTPFTPEGIFKDPLLRTAMLPVPLENLFPQIDLLLADEIRPPRLLALSDPRRLPSKPIEGTPCYRVQLNQVGEGRRVLWIDHDTYLLRRMEMPTHRVRQEMDPQGLLKSLELWIEFHDAAFGLPIDSTAFEMEIPEDAVRVRELTTPPEPLPPMLGKSVTPFTFTKLDGKPLNHEALADKIVVLDFWFTGCEPCRKSVPALEKLYARYRDADDFAVYAVSVDHERIPGDTIEQTLRRWQGTMPILRDVSELGQKQFGVQSWPTTILLGPDGKVQRIAAGASTNFDEWHRPIEKLLAGKDVAQQSIEEYRQQIEQYENKLAEMSLDAEVDRTSQVETQ